MWRVALGQDLKSVIGAFTRSLECNLERNLDTAQISREFQARASTPFQPISGIPRFSPLVPPKDQRLQRQNNCLQTKDQRVNESHRIDDVQIDLLQRTDAFS